MKEIQHKTKRTLMENNVPNMVELQLESYNWFLKKGIKELFRSFSPIKDHQDSKYSLEFVDYKLDKPKYTEAECRFRDNSTYEQPIKIRVQLTVKDEDGNVKEIIPEDIYFGELPIMTDKGTFVINGAERVIVSQLTRSPGAYFEDNIDISGTMLYTGRIIPGNGCWLEVETDARGVMQAKLAQSDKFPLTVLLRALNALEEACPVYLPSLIGKEITKDIINPATGEKLFDYEAKAYSKKTKKKKPVIFTKADYKRIKDALTDIYKDEQYPFKDYVLSPDYIYDPGLGQSTSTTLDILDTFGERTFVPVEKTYRCNTFYHYRELDEKGEPVRDKNGEILKDPYIIVPSRDPNKKVEKELCVYKKDLYKSDGENDSGSAKPYKAKGRKITEDDLAKIQEDAVKDSRRNVYSIEGLRPVKTILLREDANGARELILEEPEVISGKLRDIIASDPDLAEMKPRYQQKENAAAILEEKEGCRILCMAGSVIDRAAAETIYDAGLSFLEAYKIDPYISETLKTEQHKLYGEYDASSRTHEVADADEAVSNFYIYMNSAKSIVEDPESSNQYIRNYLFDNRRYDLGAVGRYKINKKLLLDLPEFSNNSLEPIRSITRDDLVQLIKYIISLNKDGKIIYSFDAERRDMALETIDAFIKAEEDKIKGTKDIIRKIPGSRLQKLDRFRKMFAECRKGYMFSSDDYGEFVDIASQIPYSGACLNALISNSPETLTDMCAIKVKDCVTDEIDHLENKRVRSVGELLQDQLRSGFNKLQKVCQEKMGHPATQGANGKNPEKITPGYLVTNKPITSAIRSFFGSSQLSQFMDQTNPLAELTHKRRLSALGPGGLSRQSAKLEVRDVHSSHYGRICPVETPEGPNIGLIGSMAIQAKIDEFGFLKTPYRVVRNGKITSETIELSADDETNEYIATANTRTNENGEFIDDMVNVRYNGNYKTVEKSKITLIDVSANQIMSVAANLIPFIENDDANRALMGSNMQRQAVPLLRPSAPIVRTGIEGRTAHDSGVEMLARRPGRVVWTSSKWILINPDKDTARDTYTVYSRLKAGQTVNDKEAVVKLSCSRSADKNSLFTPLADSDEVLAPAKRAGEVEILTLDGRITIAVKPDCEPAQISFTDDSYLKGVAKGDVIVGRRVYDKKKLSPKIDEEGDIVEFRREHGVPDGIVLSIETAESVDEEGNKTTLWVLSVEERDYYGVEPDIIRSTFPAEHAIFNVNDYACRSRTAGTGTGRDGRIEVTQKSRLEYTFDVKVCDDYRLYNMVRSNQNTCINSRPVVRTGDRIKADQLLADGPCTDHGELALGQNVMVAFMPWNGFNYEDAILLNQRLVKDDMFTSVHIERYETEARDAKMGAEEITREIPNTGEEAVKNLDKNGIIRIGAEVHADDILVGKVAPKGQIEETGAGRLISQIFGTKADTVKDVSLKLPHGESGTVVDVKVFSRFKFKCTNTDCRQIHEFSKKPTEPENLACERCGAPLEEYKQKDADELNAGVNQLVRVYIAQKRKIMQGDKMAGRHGNKGVISNILPECDMPYLPDGTPVDIVLNPLGVPSRMNIGQILETHQGIAGDYLDLNFKNPIFQGSKEAEIIADLIVMTNLKRVRALKEYLEEMGLGRQVTVTEAEIKAAVKKAVDNLETMTSENIKEDAAEPVQALYDKLMKGVGDYLRNGGMTPAELELFSQKIGAAPVLPAELCDKLSRLTLLQYRQGKLSEKPADELQAADREELSSLKADIKAIEAEVKRDAAVPSDYNYDELTDIIEDTVTRRVGFKAEMAKTDLYDGRTGEKMEQPVAVGIIYMLKLSHLVDDKIHARATGPYSLVTQQPLGGKAQFGGQRFGEMEVWALEAYGAAYTLQEILTIKSDDVTGRVKAFESIVKGRTLNDPGIPESFKILVNELQALCLKVTVEDADKSPIDLRSNEEDNKDFFGNLDYSFGK
ncbi:MAG: hypothetical protein IJT95_07405 [Abditibacteriota bacterium]|nr:hypothetical protein [Abditibacteriota bacterium]